MAVLPSEEDCSSSGDELYEVIGNTVTPDKKTYGSVEQKVLAVSSYSRRRGLKKGTAPPKKAGKIHEVMAKTLDKVNRLHDIDVEIKNKEIEALTKLLDSKTTAHHAEISRRDSEISLRDAEITRLKSIQEEEKKEGGIPPVSENSISEGKNGAKRFQDLAQLYKQSKEDHSKTIFGVFFTSSEFLFLLSGFDLIIIFLSFLIIKANFDSEAHVYILVGFVIRFISVLWAARVTDKDKEFELEQQAFFEEVLEHERTAAAPPSLSRKACDYTVIIDKKAGEFGFSVIGTSIARIKPACVGYVRWGDQIVSINDVHVARMTEEEIGDTIRAAEQVKLVLRYNPNLLYYRKRATVKYTECHF